MTKFKPGDHVRVIVSPCRWFDQIGTIAEAWEREFTVAGLAPVTLWFRPEELTLAEPSHQAPA
jgi:uncharacterized protein YodC (DUF2158 family)